MSAARERFAELTDRHGPSVLAYLARRVVPVADAADVYQEVLIVAWRKLDRIPAQDDAAIAWLIATARRCLANHRRGSARRHSATERLRHQIRVDEPAAGSGAVDEVRDALAQLAADDRELLTLVYWDGLTLDQAAVVLKIRPATARKRAQRARDRVRQRLSTDPAEHPAALSEV